jgi:hypothetical protein
MYLCIEDSERKLHLTAIVDRSRSAFVFYGGIIYNISLKKSSIACQERLSAFSL